MGSDVAVAGDDGDDVVLPKKTSEISPSGVSARSEGVSGGNPAFPSTRFRLVTVTATVDSVCCIAQADSSSLGLVTVNLLVT